MGDIDHAAREELARAQSLVGRTIAEKFRLDRLLGVGGMGAVYAATNTWTSRRVAVKMLLQSISGQDSVARLQQEARAASSVRHPHILDVLDMCRDEEGNFLIVTELLSGESLESMVAKRGCVDAYRAVQIVVPIAAALAAAHSKGVIHRDIKPDNIFLHSEGGHVVPKVIDFGISKISDSSLARTRTQTGAVFGTIDYMSPEQARGEAVDRTTDIWALGVVLFRMLTAQFPFEAPNVNAILIKIATGRAAPVRSVNPSIPAPVAAIVDRMLEPQRASRYDDFEAVLSDLLAWADAERTPPLSQVYRSVLPRLHAAPVVRASSIASPSFNEEPTVVDSITEGPTVSAAPTSLQWQRKSDSDAAPTTKIERPATRWAFGAVAVLALGGLSVGGWLATRPRSAVERRESAQVAPDSTAQTPVNPATNTTLVASSVTSVVDAGATPSARADGPLARSNANSSSVTGRANSTGNRGSTEPQPSAGASAPTTHHARPNGAPLNVRRNYE